MTTDELLSRIAQLEEQVETLRLELDDDEQHAHEHTRMDLDFANSEIEELNDENRDLLEQLQEHESV